jgi:transposase
MTTPLRDDYDASRLRAEARKTKDGGQARRLLAPATIYDGSSHTEAAETGGVTLQIVRDWVLKFNAVGTGGLIDGKAPGKPSRLNDTQRAALMAIVENGPIPAIQEVVRWRSCSNNSTLAIQSTPSPPTTTFSIIAATLEQTRGAAVDHHVHRPSPMGAQVLINGSWY